MTFTGVMSAKVAGIEAKAKITLTHRGRNLISAEHTGSPDELRGTGVASALVNHMVGDARKRGFKIIPLCPFVRARYEKNPE